jgi:hypothetical protein
MVVKLFHISYKLLSVTGPRVTRGLYRFEAQAGMVSIVGEEQAHLSNLRQGIVSYKLSQGQLGRPVVLQVRDVSLEVLF